MGLEGISRAHGLYRKKAMTKQQYIEVRKLIFLKMLGREELSDNDDSIETALKREGL